MGQGAGGDSRWEACGLARVLQSFMYEVKPTDTATFVAVSVLLAAVALLATYIPVRRATQYDPMVALRCEVGTRCQKVRR